MDPNLTLLGIAALNVVTAFLAWRTHSLTKQVEIATNSMKDQLVKATGDVKYAQGHNDARVEGEQKASAVAEARALDKTP